MMSSTVRIKLQTPPAKRRLNRKSSQAKEKSEKEGEAAAGLIVSQSSQEALHRGYNKYMFHHKKINLSLRQLKEELHGLKSSGNSLSRQMATMFRKFQEMRESETGVKIDDVEFEFNYDCDSDTDSQAASSACSCSSPTEYLEDDDDDDDVFLSNEKLSRATSRDSGYDSRWSGLSADAEKSLVKLLRKVSQSRKDNRSSSSSSSDGIAHSDTDDVMTDASFCSQCSCCPPSPEDSDTWSGSFCSPRSSSSDNCEDSTTDEESQILHGTQRRPSVVLLGDSGSFTLPVPTLFSVDNKKKLEAHNVDEIKNPHRVLNLEANSRSSPDGSPSSDAFCLKIGEKTVHNLELDQEVLENERPSPIGENFNLLIKENNAETTSVNIKEHVKTFELKRKNEYQTYARKELLQVTRTSRADYTTVTTVNENSLVGKRIVNLLTGHKPDEIPCITSENVGKETSHIIEVSPQTKRKSCLVVVSLRNPKEADKCDKEKKPTYTTSKVSHEKNKAGMVKSTLTLTKKKSEK